MREGAKRPLQYRTREVLLAGYDWVVVEVADAGCIVEMRDPPKGPWRDMTKEPKPDRGTPLGFTRHASGKYVVEWGGVRAGELRVITRSTEIVRVRLRASRDWTRDRLVLLTPKRMAVTLSERS